MWYDPSKAIDPPYLRILPFLDRQLLGHFPLREPHLGDITQVALDSHDVAAVAGATILLLSKREVASVREHFPLEHSGLLHQLCYLISERGMAMRHKHSLALMTVIVMRGWLKGQPPELMRTIAGQIKNNCRDLVLGMQLRKEEVAHIRAYHNGIEEWLGVPLLPLVERELGASQAKKWKKAVQSCALFIRFNKKELFLLRLMEEQHLALVEAVCRRECRVAAGRVVLEHLTNILYHVLNIVELTIVMELLSFVCQKLLLLYPRLRAPLTPLRHELLGRLEDLMHRHFFSRSTLEKQLGIFTYALKPNHLFYYLEVLYADRPPLLRLLMRCKGKLFRAYEAKGESKHERVTEEEVQETVFFIQLRPSRAKSPEGELYPCLNSRTVNRALLHPFFVGVGGRESEALILNRIAGRLRSDSPKQLLLLWEEFNWVEKSIFGCYVIATCEWPVRTLKERRDREAKVEVAWAFLEELPDAEVLGLTEFFLCEIELHHNYSLLTTLLFTRIQNFFCDYREIQDSARLGQLLRFSRFFFCLLRASLPPQTKPSELPHLCKACHALNEGCLCRVCEHICVPVRIDGSAPERQEQREMVDKLRRMAGPIQEELDGLREGRNHQWVWMWSLVLETLELGVDLE